MHTLISSFFLSDKENDTQTVHHTTSAKERKKMYLALLKKLNCRTEINEEGGILTINFYYQGSYFAISLESERQDQLILPLVAQVPYANLHLVQSICNHLNMQSEMGRVAYVYNHKSHQLEVCVMTGLVLVGTPDTKLNLLHGLIQMGFSLCKAFNDIYEKEVDDNGTGFDEDADMERQREEYLLKEQEIAREPAFVTKWREDYHTVTLGCFLDCTFDDGMIVPCSISVRKSSPEGNVTTETVESGESVRNYPLWNALIMGEGDKAAFAFPNAVLVVTFTTQVGGEDGPKHQLYIMIQSAGEANNTLYMRVTATIPPFGYLKRTTSFNSANRVHSRSLLLAYDKTDDRRQRSEFEYMWHDIQDKKRLHNLKELTGEQRFILDCDEDELAARLYWGRKYFLRKDYWHALLYLEDAYTSLQWKYEKLSQKMLHIFNEVCYMVGFSYSELGAYKKAFYYLDIVSIQDNLIYLKAYVNCLVKSGDFRSIEVIEGLTDRLEDALDDEDELGEAGETSIQDFYFFLLQRKIMGYINGGDLEEAENLCRALMKMDNGSKDFALDELAKIQKLRRREEREKGDEK